MYRPPLDKLCNYIVLNHEFKHFFSLKIIIIIIISIIIIIIIIRYICNKPISANNISKLINQISVN